MTKKIITKFPKEKMTITEIEKWLEDMASDGLILQTLNADRSTFVEDEPRYIKYRIIPLGDYILNKDIREYKEQGYERANKHSPDLTVDYVHYYVFRCLDPKNDIDIKGHEIDQDYKKRNYVYKYDIHTMNIIRDIVMSLAYLPMLAIIRNNISIHGYCVFLWLYLFAFCDLVVNIIKKRKLKLLEKRPVSEDEIDIVIKPKQNKKLNILSVARNLMFVLLGVMAIIFFRIDMFEKITTPIYNKNIITLSEIESYDNADEYTDEKQHYGIAATTLLIPDYYSISEKLEIGNQIKSSYSIKYYKFLFKNMVPWAIEKWEDDTELHTISGYEKEYTSSDVFETIVYFYYDEKEDKNLCFYGNKMLIMISYEGNAQPEQIIDAVDNEFKDN